MWLAFVGNALNLPFFICTKTWIIGFGWDGNTDTNLLLNFFSICVRDQPETYGFDSSFRLGGEIIQITIDIADINPHRVYAFAESVTVCFGSDYS